MLKGFKGLLKKRSKKDQDENDVNSKSKEAAKERLHLVLMQDRANVSVDFLDMMKQEIIDVIKKYIDVDESEIDVRLTNKINEDGTNGAPALYANIPIISIKNDNTVKKVAGMKISEVNNLKKTLENKNGEKMKSENKEKSLETVNEKSKKENKNIKTNVNEQEKPKRDDELNKEENKIENKSVKKMTKKVPKDKTSSVNKKSTAKK